MVVLLQRLADAAFPVVHKLAVGMFFSLLVATGVIMSYLQFEVVKHDPIYALTFLINIVVVVTTAVWSYKSFGQAIKDLKKSMGAAVRNQQRTDLQITNIYAYLRSFGSRLRKLDDIELEVVEQELLQK